MKTVPFKSALGLATLLIGSVTAALAQTETIKMAVRSDARPFIWKNDASGMYLGFFWDICTNAVQRAGYQFELVEINSEQRGTILQSGTPEIDLLCDPTTITLQRMKNFSTRGQAPDLDFSQIVFVANSSFVRPEPGHNRLENEAKLPSTAPESPTCEDIFSWVEFKRNPDGAKQMHKWARAEPAPAKASKDTAESKPAEGFWSWLQQNVSFTLPVAVEDETAKQRSYQIWGYVEGTTIGDDLEMRRNVLSQNDTTVCTKGFKSHKEAASELCNGALSRYYGDVDIVRAALADFRVRNERDCPADLSTLLTGAYEPYAFVVSSRNVDTLPEDLRLSLYGMFADGTIDRIFAGHFQETQISEYLRTLFRINSIRAGTPTDTVDGTSSTSRDETSP
ncbi:MAG: transporter substrate-binding domain-containing protein [Pseudomonadota bacterium]